MADSNSSKTESPVDIKEIILTREHAWNGRTIIPKGDTVLRVGDSIVLYTKGKGVPIEEE